MLVVVGLVILGPERLPGAINWFFTALRQVRDYATGATQQLKNEMGDDFDSIREPLQQIQNLRGMTPTAAITKHLLNGDDSVIRDMRDQVRSTADSLNVSKVINGTDAGGAGSVPGAPSGAPEPAVSAASEAGPVPSMPRVHRPLPPGERPPFDPDAT